MYKSVYMYIHINMNICIFEPILLLGLNKGISSKRQFLCEDDNFAFLSRLSTVYRGCGVAVRGCGVADWGCGVADGGVAWLSGQHVSL